MTQTSIPENTTANSSTSGCKERISIGSEYKERCDEGRVINLTI